MGKTAATVATICKLLFKKGLVSEEQCRMVLAGADNQAARLHSHQQTGYSRRFFQAAEQVSPAEIISSFNLEIPGTGKILTEDAITETLAQAAGLEYVKIDPLKMDLDLVTDHVTRAFALKNLIVPIGMRDGAVVFAQADPFNNQALEDISQVRHIATQKVLASRSDILKILREFFGFRASVNAAQGEVAGGVDLANLEQFVQMRGHGEAEGSDKHIISAVEFLLQYAFDQRASDIHIEPFEKKVRLRYRIDGVLVDATPPPKNLQVALMSRLKVMS
ncbi:MAG: type II/IV secretion system protein, partial [Geobacter sp.]|nr:type II/IV secretion system protein [Geobacter sp.]